MIAQRILFIYVATFLSVVAFAQSSVQQWGRFETSFNYNVPGNGFTDVSLSATFTNGDTSIKVNGFYDGGNTFKIRFMPPTLGTWNYITNSNVNLLKNKRGSFECTVAIGKNHGPVKVQNKFHFGYADGKVFYPIGTTAYAWNHMGKVLQQQTFNSLQQSGFNKIRMCVFPKNYDLVVEEPELFPYEKNASAISKNNQWNLSRFNPVFFSRLEEQIEALQSLGIEVDLIVFHPYDKGRWGFDAMSQEDNFRYIHYLTARLSSFKNIWWSVANEWDLVKPKSHEDWVALTKEIYNSDPYRHLLSIHGSTAKYFEYWMPEITHVSVQDEAPVMHEGVVPILRNVYGKPVICDEVGYEGNLTQRWGRYSGEEMTRLMWNGIMGGAYVTHGETYAYHDNTDTIFWAKGGTFKGSSWKRAAFLRKILEENPGPLEPADVSRDMRTATAGEGTYYIYWGKEIQELWYFNLPAKNGHFKAPQKGERYKVEIIDTWEMTVKSVADEFTLGELKDYRYFDRDMKKIRLPMKPYLALRITKINN